MGHRFAWVWEGGCWVDEYDGTGGFVGLGSDCDFVWICSRSNGPELMPQRAQGLSFESKLISRTRRYIPRKLVSKPEQRRKEPHKHSCDRCDI